MGGCKYLSSLKILQMYIALHRKGQSKGFAFLSYNIEVVNN